MKFKDSLLAIFVVFCWALNLIAVRFAIAEIPVFILTGARFLLVAACILPFVKIPYGNFKKIFILSLILGVGHFASFFYGMNFIGAGLTAIILNLQSPIGLVLAAFILKERIPLIRCIGVLIAFLGIVLLYADPEAANNIKGVLFVLIGGFMWGLANIYIKISFKQKINFQILGWMSLFSGIILSLIGVLSGNSFDSLLIASERALAGLAFTILISTIVAYGIWFRLLEKYEINLLSPFTLLIPAFGIAAGYLFAGESITVVRVIGAGIVISGVALSFINKKSLLAV